MKAIRIKLKMFVAFMFGLIFLSSTPIFVKGAHYSFDVDTSYYKEYELKTWDKDVAEDVLGTGDAEDYLGKGADEQTYKAWAIKEIDSSSNKWEITGYNTLEWTDDKSELQDVDEDEANVYDEDNPLKLYKDPADYGEDLKLGSLWKPDIMIDSSSAIKINAFEGNTFFTVITLLKFGAPNPVHEYLDEIDFDIDGLKVEGNGYILKYFKEDSGYDEDVYIYYTWKENGVFLSERMTTTGKDASTIYEISLVESVINPVNVIIFLIVVSVGVIVVILVIRKIKNNK